MKIMVEMIKREWPQQWPTLLQELDQMQGMGVSDSPGELSPPFSSKHLDACTRVNY